MRYKDEFAKLLEEKAPNFGVKNLKIVSFSAQRGFGFKYTAADAAVAINAMLELSGSCLPDHNFHNALEALRTEQMCEMQSGIELGKKQLRAVLNTINSNIEMGTVINAGPFLYMLLKDGNPEHHMFAHPASVRLLGMTHPLLTLEEDHLTIFSDLSPVDILPISAASATRQDSGIASFGSRTER